MTKLNELIQQFCPDGVEYKTLGSFATISRGGNFQKKDFRDDAFTMVRFTLSTAYLLTRQFPLSALSAPASRKLH